MHVGPCLATTGARTALPRIDAASAGETSPQMECAEPPCCADLAACRCCALADAMSRLRDGSGFLAAACVLPLCFAFGEPAGEAFRAGLADATECCAAAGVFAA